MQENNSQNVNIRAFVNELKKAHNLRFDKQVAELFEVSKNTVSNWIKRNSIPTEYLFKYFQANPSFCGCFLYHRDSPASYNKVKVCWGSQRVFGSLHMTEDEWNVWKKIFSPDIPVERKRRAIAIMKMLVDDLP